MPLSFEQAAAYRKVNGQYVRKVTLYHKGQREVWNNTEILNGVGRIEAKDQQIQSVFGNELIHIMETAKKASEAMSVAQQKKAEDRIKAAGEDVKNYSVF